MSITTCNFSDPSVVVGFGEVFILFRCHDVFSLKVVWEDVRGVFELHEVPYFFLLWCSMPSGRVLKKCFFTVVSLIVHGSCAVLHVSSSAGVGVLCISESRNASHSSSLVHISSI